MARQKDWVNEFTAQYLEKGGLKSQALDIAQKQAITQEMLHGSIVDIWEPADAAANLLFKEKVSDAVEMLNDLFEKYDFGEDFEVEAFNGWEFDGKSRYERAVFIKAVDPENNNKQIRDTQKIIFFAEVQKNKIQHSGIL